MFFIDTHCHLNYELYRETLPQTLERAIDAGINRLVVPGTDLESSLRAVDLAMKYPMIFAAVGVHPIDIHKFHESQVTTFDDLLRNDKVVAVGEVGLDKFHHPETISAQEDIFDIMLNLASTHHKPLILHSRNAINDLLALLQKWVLREMDDGQKFLGVFHGFEGNADQAIEVINNHMAIGVGGPITFKNAIDKQNLLRIIGVNQIVLETDAPFLSPHPFRGQPNEPARIPIIAQKVADLLNLNIEDIATITNRNSQSLFRWDDIH